MRPLRFGDAIEVSLAGLRLSSEAEPTEVTLGWCVTKIETAETAAIGQVVHTFVDAKSFRRTLIPDAILDVYRRLIASG